MPSSPNNQPVIDSSRRRARSARLVRWGGVGLLLAAAGAGLIYLGPQLAARLRPPVPTPACVEPALTLGEFRFRIQTLQRAADGRLAVPPGTPDIAYWIEGTQPNYVFALSFASPNPSLEDAIEPGDEATIVWADCGRDEYVVRAVETGRPDDWTLFDQSTSGITVFVQTGPSAEGFVVRGRRPETQIVDTPGPTEANTIQAEVSFLETATSPDGATLRLSIAIKNTGLTAFTLADGDISLAAENAAPLAPLSVEPALPRELQPGAGETLFITFPRPAGAAAVFRILDFSVDLYY